MSCNLEDRVLWTVFESGKLSVKCLYDALEPGGSVPLLRSIIWSPCSSQGKFFRVENSMGKDLILNQVKKRG